MIRLNDYRRFLKESGYARTTIATGMPPLIRFAMYLKKQRIKEEATPTVVERYFKYLRAKEYSEGTIRSMRIVLRRYFRFVAQQGDCVSDPTAGIQLAKKEVPRKLYFSMDQMK